MNFQRLSSYVGVAGCVVLLIAVGISIGGYSGMDGEAYSMVNHFISELGDRHISPLSAVFNWGLMFAAAMLFVYALGFASRFHGWQQIAIGILAITTSVSCFFVGVFPMDILQPHLVAAMIFFHSALVLVFVNTAITLFARKPLLPKWTVLPGMVTAATFAAFVLAPNDEIRAWVRDPIHFVRPAIWMKCYLEWACFFSILLWIMVVGFVGSRGVQTQESQARPINS